MVLVPVETEQKELAAYRPLIGRYLFEQIEKRARKLAGLKVTHLNATSEGGGVVELLRSVVPLLNSVGVKTTWYTLSAPDAFFEVTKKIHNLLQGKRGSLTKKEKSFYLQYNRYFAQAMEEIETDLWVIHDPQPAAVILYNSFHPIIWRCHLDTSSTTKRMWSLFSFIKNYDKYIFSMREYANSHFKRSKKAIFPPAIDPLSPKNWPLDSFLADSHLANLGADPQKPIMTQVGRFDPWKDPVGVITAYQLAKKEIPQLQLILTGEMAADDPEDERILKEVQRAAGADPDIYIWADKKRSDLKINAIQVASDVILQKSIREGFGLTVTEAMWKGKVVIGGNCGGIRLQIKNKENGFLVESPQEAAEKIVWVLRNPKKAATMGRRAKESVRQNFLTPRLLNNYLGLFEELLPQVQAKKPIGQSLRISPLSQIRHFPAAA